MHFRKHYEKGLITKELTVTHTHLNVKLKLALYFCTLDYADIKLFKSGTKLF